MEIKEYVQTRKDLIRQALQNASRVPSLAILQVGDNAASNSYIRGKLKDCAEVGIKATLFHYPDTISEKELLSEIKRCNQDPAIDAFLVQLPLPKAISERAIHLTIDPKKDIDGFSPLSAFASCTPKGIVDYLADEGFPFKGANAVVLGRSNIVGKPMAKMLTDKDCNVTLLHSKTSDGDMRFYLSHADLIVVAIGRLGHIDLSYELKPTAWVVDVGINRDEDGHLRGDCVPGLKVARQTPVPGGVGLLTRLALITNIMEVLKR
ncbi:MAG: bifunctional 5,10-methylenetetrahydrofolate dehydrogenase/5,10-methenyltetrahydrofolate cyclohydrolase [Bacilli bacterium]|jgi:methylenetetrahydrofolate dehydrogenase (NADP+)/methenyltetrahydrofolate cyclohydrolase|nr:bifunctional 5,10-methylenetetrahydrofolate dehydrogenase/5,10-methenyltetrahydrofolate cyclohydrolase [Bacilli bacterium]